MMQMKPCPHCGGEPYIVTQYNKRLNKFMIYCRCDVCGAQGKTYASCNNPAEADWESPESESAISAWNLRTYERLENALQDAAKNIEHSPADPDGPSGKDRRKRA